MNDKTPAANGSRRMTPAALRKARAGATDEVEQEKQSEAELLRETLRLRKLAEVLRAHSLDRASGLPDQNEKIPAGYTYLGQMIAHDLTFHDLHNRSLRNTRGVRSFSRSPGLDLDCIYGEGPEASPWLYEREAISSMPRRRLRLGRVCADAQERDAVLHGRCDNNNVPIGPSGPFLDLPRVATRHLSGGEAHPQAFDTLVADARNEENLILSQLTVLFYRFHNKVVDRLETIDGPPTRQRAADYYERQHFRARAVTVQCYRRMIAQDFLRLLLHPEVYGDFTAGKRPKHSRFMKPGEREIPDLFWMTAFRVGHVMVRDDYSFPPIAGRGPAAAKEGAPLPRVMKTLSLLNFNGNGGSSNVPITREWVLDWNLFFNMTASNAAGAATAQPMFNFSQRFLPVAAPALLYRFGLPESEEDFGLLHRDLSRAAYNGLPCAQDLLDPVDKQIPPEAIRKWLTKESSSIRRDDQLSEPEIADLVERTPLLFYLLCEAAAQGEDGESLGMLGSRIIGEVMFRVLAAPSGFEDPEALEAVFGEKIPKTAADFVRFATTD